MGRGLGNGRAFAAAMLCLGAPAVAADVDGAEDPPVAARFPGSTIVAFQPETRQRSYEFVTGRVDRSSRDLRVDRGERVQATLSRITYLTPEGARFDDVAGHYRSIVAGLDAEVAFTCRGRDCGRSTVWANDVFGVKELVAPDAAQFYLAATTNDAVLAIYVVQRGNRRVYAHVDYARTEGDLRNALDAAAQPGADLAEALAERGYVVLRDVEPNATGELAPAALDALDAAASALATLGERTIYLVCHLDGEAQAALRSARKCAALAVQRFHAAGLDARPFAAGALLPRPGERGRRIELVLPSAP